MKRVIGAAAGIEYFKRERNLPVEAVMSDGRGLFPDKVSPNEFAARVIDIVRNEGDAGLARINTALDGSSPDVFEVPQSEIDSALANLDPASIAAFELAAERVRKFQSRGLPKSWSDGTGKFGEKVTPLNSIAAYVPGGTAPLASTVIMTVVPAQVAGVKEIIVATPAPGDSMPHPAVLAAAKIAGASRVFKIGGAQAVAALAYGTESIPAVDLICGPGSAWVTAAKKLVFGDVGIDGLYGPTETLVIADESADPRFTASDLIAQAEHDTVAMPILVALSEEIVDKTQIEIDKQLAELPRGSTAEAAFSNRGVAVIVDSTSEAVDVANAAAPEHLCILTADADDLVDSVTSAGGLFVGEWSAEVMADYVAGPSHVMPTAGTARFTSALSVRNFVRVTPVLTFDDETFLKLSKDAELLAKLEGLHGHAAASEYRRRHMVGE
ncbi:histidinol dehydrogenase [Candidatus Lucifugimonas marina]|uniref:Histidinol dehydrogenase n=1 Tax=Candidatus Lucifugimonas marina TaxID=3038979 RepID=A0ABD4XN22_9CHLR|nr:histidinol dehydrogenase [SAR202 cluster bacterium JH702]WFG35385.1 histidinol dehydrogenase [SAR202 cluster bacterium JH545]